MPDTISVPDVIGRPQAEAAQVLTGAGLVLGTVTKATSVTVPVDNVSATNPAAGTSVSPGSAVNLEVSSGPAQAAQINVPDVVGRAQAEAAQALTSAGLVLGTVIKATSTTVPADKVSGTNPTAGTSISPGSAVNLEVSSGPAPVAVPNVIGRTRGAAEGLLKAAGLVVGAVKKEHSNSVPTDGISSSTPDVGTIVSPGSTVDLELSSGPEPDWTQYIPTVLFGLLGLIILAGIVYAVTEPSGLILGRLKEKDAARGLITFLIAIATVGIAIVLAISTLILTEGDAGDKRFDRGKQVLSILIGVLGTIVGFYFGSETNNAGQANPTAQTQTSPQITTSTLPDGAVNNVYSATLRTTGLNPPLQWSVMPALPDGLTLEETTGVIKGTPKTAKTRTVYKFAVMDSSAPAVTLMVEIPLEIK